MGWLRFVLVVVALVCALAILLGIGLGLLTPHLLGLALVCLALAMLIDARPSWPRPTPPPA
jgi:hypothetical protein